MRKAAIHDYLDIFGYEEHDDLTDPGSFIMARALSIFEGAKKDLFVDLKDEDAKRAEEAKRTSLWSRSQQVAIVRAKWDQPISTVRQLLSFCTTKSLEDNRQHILDYFVECYDWIDLAVAIKIYESIAHPEFAYIVDKISFDRHYNNNRERYSDGKSGEPYLTINMLNGLTVDDLEIYIKEYFGVLYSDNLPKPKINEATPQLLRNILVRNMHFLYDIKPKELIWLIEEIFSEYEEHDPRDAESGGEKFKKTVSIPAEVDGANGYIEQNASNDFRKFNREFERDWFRAAINTFRSDKTKYLNEYKDHYMSTMARHCWKKNKRRTQVREHCIPTMVEHGSPKAPFPREEEDDQPNYLPYLLDDPIYESDTEHMQRFELEFNSKRNLFSLKKYKKQG